MPRATGSPARRAGDRTGADRPSHRGGAAHADQKYDAITAQLAAKDHADLLPEERSRIQQRLQRLVAEAWHTDEIRKVRPTPVDEAKWGFAVIEHSLWQALPNVLRHVDEVLLRSTGERLPLTAAPLRFASWMGATATAIPTSPPA